MPADAPPTQVTVDEARELAATWARGLDRLAADMYAFLVQHIPEAAEPDLAGLTLASCASNVEAILSMIRHGIPVSATEAPVAALEHARRMAVRGRGVDATLRFYRLGHAHLWEQWSAALAAAVPDRDRLVVALQETAAFTFHYIDQVSARVGAEHIAERERLQRRAALVRADVVRSVLAGERVDPGAAERALGHPLAPPHLAFVCWTAGDPAALERAAQALAQVLGGPRPLLVPDGPAVLGVWAIAGQGPVPTDALARAVRDAAPEVHVACGAPAPGLAGFRVSREQAERARRIAELADRRPGLTAYAEVALADLLSRDLEAARAFVAAELGALADPHDGAAGRAREALAAVVAPDGGIAAAARALDLHRNTVLQRVRRGEELRGRPLTERPAELHAALLLAQVLGPAVLRS
ncbi:helix-turn-helix domain-containing protein [Conexibacter sp. W3-3-2]|uniref:PucR family transcriptional regulator n=1 Tax=Conexibacter sp. W3-3-2 TaxID=2675227 RepID=UPI0028163DE8|nr:helix-turn-helix domain-containing protein [Conexibacter sp. W3-3-2]